MAQQPPLLRDVFDIKESISPSAFVLQLSGDDPRRWRARVAGLRGHGTAAGELRRGARADPGRARRVTLKAAYLHGSFGSGKSHFMTVLHALLSGPPRPAHGRIRTRFWPSTSGSARRASGSCSCRTTCSGRRHWSSGSRSCRPAGCGRGHRAARILHRPTAVHRPVRPHRDRPDGSVRAHRGTSRPATTVVGRCWQVTFIDWGRKRVFVEPVDSGGTATRRHHVNLRLQPVPGALPSVVAS